MTRTNPGKIALMLATGTVIGLTTIHNANAADRVRVHGTVENLDGDRLTIKGSDGQDIVVTIRSGLKVLGVKNASAADVRTGDFVGIGSQPTAGGINGAVLGGLIHTYIQFLTLANAVRG